MNNYKDIKISLEQAEHILLELYGISGTAFQLHGELDFNFRIKVKGSDGYILKISRPDEDYNYLNFQQKLLLYTEEHNKNLIIPKVVKDKKGNSISEITDDFGKIRTVRLLTWISGRVWCSVNPQLDNLRFSLGKQCGLLTQTLQGFEHPKAHRKFEWDIAQALWTKDYLHLFEDDKKTILDFFISRFEANKQQYDQLRKSVVHNDANDYNVIVSNDLINSEVVAIIDYGDAIYTQTINDLAIACAYGIMHHNDALNTALPIVKGYHLSFPLLQEELIHLYDAIAMRLVISVTKSAINKINEPDNEYLLISEKPAWEVLKKWRLVSPHLALYAFRNACDYHAHPNLVKFKKWALDNTFYLKDLFPLVKKNQVQNIDLSVSSLWIGHKEEFSDLEFFEFKVNHLQKQTPGHILAGGYLEPRSIYTSTSYDKEGNSGKESRTIHLGVDFWLPKGTDVYALLDGQVVVATNDKGDKEYGGLLILRHRVEGFEFYTLYGHNTVASVMSHKVGDFIRKGEKITELATYPENGNWAPHLHFQIMLSLLDYKIDFPGVAYHNQINIWKGICPDPNLLFKLDALTKKKSTTNKVLISYRKKHLGRSLSLQYKEPVNMVRGEGEYLIDEHGQKYLDTVNNVAHVGHENYNIVKAGQEQMALLNTNTRYLHKNINELTNQILETLPPELCVVHFVNSGSEANELAIRMVKAATGQKDIIASEAGYHGNSNTCIDISSYKFDGKGGQGAPEYTHIIPLPDTYRGKYKGKDAGIKYAKEVLQQIDIIHKKGRGLGAFIIEPIISCGGQIELPKGFLNKAYNSVRDAGGLCISDEVQVGCGRLGKTFWGFQLHNVVPDIVTIGKPLGNGHPIAAVVCTQKVADAFANDMEYFNTFGGNPVSCAIGSAILKFVKDNSLQQNALKVGKLLKSELKKLSNEFPIIGDVRGQGLFLGFELVDSNINPLAKQADYLVNRMKDYHILMSSDGPDHNVIKIKPPLIFSIENTRELIYYLRKVLAEDFMTVC